MLQLHHFEFANWALRLVLAQSVIVLFLLLNVVSLSMPHAGDLKPFFLLMAVFYWAIYRPTVMPSAYTFLLGLTVDLLSNLPFGMSALILLAIQTLVRRSRLFLMGQPYMMVWLGFAITALAYAAAVWFLITLRGLTFPPKNAVYQMLAATGLTILLFPLASIILQGVHRLLPVSNSPMRAVR